MHEFSNNCTESPSDLPLPLFVLLVSEDLEALAFRTLSGLAPVGELLPSAPADSG